MAQAPNFVAVERTDVDPGNRRPRNVNLALLLTVCGLLLIAAFFGGRQWLYAQSHEDTANAAVESNIYQVQAIIPGVISEVLVQENQYVKRGDVLARLDSSEVHLRQKQAATALQLARQQSEAARLQVSQIQAAVGLRARQVAENAQRIKLAAGSAQGELKKLAAAEKPARKALSAAEENLRHVSNQHRNLLVLARQGLAGPSVMEQAEAAMRNARAQVDGAKNQLNAIHLKANQMKQLLASAQAAKSSGGSRGDEREMIARQIATARQQYAATLTAVKQAGLAAEHARLAANYTSITAPADGIIVRKGMQIGQRVQPGQPLVALVQPGAWVTANFDEKQIARIHPGQKVAVRVAAMPDRVIWGRVESTAPAAFLQSPPQSAPAKPEAAAKSTAQKSDSKVAVATNTSQPQSAPVQVQPQPRQKPSRTVPVKITFEPQSLKGMERVVLPGMSAQVSVRVKS